MVVSQLSGMEITLSEFSKCKFAVARSVGFAETHSLQTLVKLYNLVN